MADGGSISLAVASRSRDVMIVVLFCSFVDTSPFPFGQEVLESLSGSSRVRAPGDRRRARSRSRSNGGRGG